MHSPDAISHGITSLALALGVPVHPEGSVVAFFRGLTVATTFVIGAILFSGYLLFGFAPPANGQRITTYIFALITCVLCSLVYPFSAWVWGGVWVSNMANGLFLVSGWVLYVIHCARIDSALAKRYVLFFRRFDSFSDLSILPSLLRLSPRRVPVVMLVSGNENEIGYWDPVKLMSFGLHTNLPWGGRPIFLRGGQLWESAMKSLVARAGVVILDQTEKSDAMMKELNTVAKSDRPLILISETADVNDHESVALGAARATPIYYHRDRRQLAVRAALVLAIVALVAFLTDLPGQILAKREQGELWGGLFGAAVMLGFVAAITGGLLLRRGLSRDTRKRIAEAIRVSVEQPHPS